MSQARKITNKFSEAINEGYIDKESLIKNLLNYLSEAEVIDFIESYAYDEILDFDF